MMEQQQALAEDSKRADEVTSSTRASLWLLNHSDNNEKEAQQESLQGVISITAGFRKLVWVGRERGLIPFLAFYHHPRQDLIHVGWLIFKAFVTTIGMGLLKGRLCCPLP